MGWAGVLCGQGISVCLPQGAGAPGEDYMTEVSPGEKQLLPFTFIQRSAS